MCPVLSYCLNKSFIYCIELGLGVFFGRGACVLPVTTCVTIAMPCIPPPPSPISVPSALGAHGRPWVLLPALGPCQLGTALLGGSSQSCSRAECLLRLRARRRLLHAQAALSQLGGGGKAAVAGTGGRKPPRSLP